jgi:hypothetical protein
MSVSSYLDAISYIENGDWDASHQLIQKYHTQIACWIHAHLHRIEGDLWNANYWYERAGRKASDHTLEEERNQIKSYILNELQK